MLIGCSLSLAQAWAADSSLSLSTAIEIAVKHNTELNALRDEKGLYEAARIRAGLLPNPTVELEAATGRFTGNKRENNMTVAVSQELSLAGKRRKRIAIAEREMDMYSWRLADRDRLLREEVKTDFLDALLAKERAALAERYVIINRQLFEVARERFAVGDIPELELNLVKVELARSEVNRVEMSKAMQQSLSRLSTVMGLVSGSQPEIEGALEAGIDMAKQLPELKQLAGASRPDIKLLEAEKARGDADIALAQAEKIPDLTAGVLFKRERTAADSGGVNTVGVRLSVPLPLFDRNQAGIMEARTKKYSTENRFVAATKTVEREVEAAYATYLSATTVLSLYKADIIPQLEENLKLTQDAYRLGEVGILPVIQEQKKFFEVNDGYLTALHSRQIALVKLESVTASELNGGKR